MNKHKMKRLLVDAGLWNPLDIGDDIKVQTFGRSHYIGYACALIEIPEGLFLLEIDVCPEERGLIQDGPRDELNKEIRRSIWIMRNQAQPDQLKLLQELES